VSPIEIVAALLGLANIALVVRRSLWNYPFALAMVTLYAWVYFHQKLYSDALLQGFFFALNLYGWWNWRHARADTGTVRVETLSAFARAAWLTGSGVATLGWGALMHRFTDAHYPWWDGAILVLSVAAQILQSRRNWECWLLWIAIDLLAIPLFAIKGMLPTMVLYCVFLAMSVLGLVDWLKARHA
jgi:nicotinamide mononucleotide transporter